MCLIADFEEPDILVCLPSFGTFSWILLTNLRPDVFYYHLTGFTSFDDNW